MTQNNQINQNIKKKKNLVKMNLQELEQLSVKSLYRILIKNMQFYPSKNRFPLLLQIKEDFRANANLTDEKQLKIELKKAKIGVRHILMYKAKNQELIQNYRIADQGFVDSINKKDKDFIYF